MTSSFRALREADVILLVGARLNWILHFGKPPRFDANVKIIQVDICPEEMNNNVPSHVMLCGDVKHTIQLISDELYSDSSYGGADRQSKWWTELLDKVNSNVATNKMLSDDESVPMSFYCAYKQITKYLPPDAVVVNEGANTMDVGRTVIPSHYPRLRLDAGTFGTMGVGCGFAIAAALYNQATSADNKAVPPVYCIQGDSAFGFSGMELETACRYRLPIIFIIMNNSGIYRGVSADQWEEIYKGDDLMINVPPTSLLHSARYDKMAECFGCRGFDVTTPLQLREAVEWAMNNVGSLPTVINVHINPSSERKQQEFPWLTKSNL
jgi:2-hydroxyacyl-CoA lyase 1